MTRSNDSRALAVSGYRLGLAFFARPGRLKKRSKPHGQTGSVATSHAFRINDSGRICTDSDRVVVLRSASVRPLHLTPSHITAAGAHRIRCGGGSSCSVNRLVSARIGSNRIASSIVLHGYSSRCVSHRLDSGRLGLDRLLVPKRIERLIHRELLGLVSRRSLDSRHDLRLGKFRQHSEM